MLIRLFLSTALLMPSCVGWKASGDSVVCFSVVDSHLHWQMTRYKQHAPAFKPQIAIVEHMVHKRIQDCSGTRSKLQQQCHLGLGYAALLLRTTLVMASSHDIMHGREQSASARGGSNGAAL